MREPSPPTNQRLEHPLAALPKPELVELIAALRTSRKSVKRRFHRQGWPSDAAALDAAELYLRRRPDWRELDRLATTLIDERRAGLAAEAFDLIAVTRSRLSAAGVVTQGDRVDFATRHQIAVESLDAIMEGRDLSASEIGRVLAALGARFVEFGGL